MNMYAWRTGMALGLPGPAAAANARPLSGSMASSIGNAMAVPTPRRSVRRESSGLLLIIFLLYDRARPAFNVDLCPQGVSSVVHIQTVYTNSCAMTPTTSTAAGFDDSRDCQSPAA